MTHNFKILIVIFIFSIFSCEGDDLINVERTPSISSFTVTNDLNQQFLSLQGEGFGFNTDDVTVLFDNDEEAKIIRVNNNTLVTRIPAYATSGNIRLVVNGFDTVSISGFQFSPIVLSSTSASFETSQIEIEEDDTIRFNLNLENRIETEETINIGLNNRMTSNSDFDFSLLEYSSDFGQTWNSSNSFTDSTVVVTVPERVGQIRIRMKIPNDGLVETTEYFSFKFSPNSINLLTEDSSSSEFYLIEDKNKITTSTLGNGALLAYNIVDGNLKDSLVKPLVSNNSAKQYIDDTLKHQAIYDLFLKLAPQDVIDRVVALEFTYSNSKDSITTAYVYPKLFTIDGLFENFVIGINLNYAYNNLTGLYTESADLDLANNSGIVTTLIQLISKIKIYDGTQLNGQCTYNTVFYCSDSDFGDYFEQFWDNRDGIDDNDDDLILDFEDLDVYSFIDKHLDSKFLSTYGASNPTNDYVEMLTYFITNETVNSLPSPNSRVSAKFQNIISTQFAIDLKDTIRQNAKDNSIPIDGETLFDFYRTEVVDNIFFTNNFN